MKQIKTALISVYYKDGIDEIAKKLHELDVHIISSGGTAKYIADLGIPVTKVEDITGYPSILDGRVKTLHPKIFGGILTRREESYLRQLKEYDIPEIDLVIVNLYPFDETVANTDDASEIIEKIDIGGPSMIGAAAKNYKDVVIIGKPSDYQSLLHILQDQGAETSMEQRKTFAVKAFRTIAHYRQSNASWFETTIS